MHVNVGPFRYRVKLVRGYIRYEGEDCLGLCDNLAQRILISDVPPETQRLQVFFHELMHAWWYHFGVDCDDEEQVVDLVGVAMTDFLIQAVRTMRLAALTEAGGGVESVDDGGADADTDAVPAGLTDGPMPVLRIQRGDPRKSVRTDSRDGSRRDPPNERGEPVRPRRRIRSPRFTPACPAEAPGCVGVAADDGARTPGPIAVEADNRWTIRIYDPAGVATASVDRSASS